MYISNIYTYHRLCLTFFKCPSMHFINEYEINNVYICYLSLYSEPILLDVKFTLSRVSNNKRRKITLNFCYELIN